MSNTILIKSGHYCWNFNVFSSEESLWVKRVYYLALSLVALPCLVLSRPVWPHLALFRPVSPCLVLSSPLSPCLDPSHPVCTRLTLSRPVSPCLAPSGLISPCLVLSRPISSCLALSRPVWTRLTLSGPVSPCLVLYRSVSMSCLVLPYLALVPYSFITFTVFFLYCRIPCFNFDFAKCKISWQGSHIC